MKEACDVAIVGAGPGGLTAGIYTARAGLDTVILDKGLPGGQMATTDVVENYPGIVEPVGGMELAQRMTEQAKRFGVAIESAEVTALAIEGDEKALTTSAGVLRAPAVIAAPGTVFRRLNVPGEERFWGRGISCCATCDGMFYRDKEVVVVGGGDTAVKEGLFLTRFASKVTLIHRRDRLRATKILRDRLLASEKMAVRWNTVVDEIRGDKVVEAVILREPATGRAETFRCDGVFLFVGTEPSTGFLKGVVALDERGYALTDEEMATDIPGIYACRDARKKTLRQIVTACGEGAVAAFSAQKHIENLRGEAYPGR